jgi:hypothetical protein
MGASFPGVGYNEPETGDWGHGDGHEAHIQLIHAHKIEENHFDIDIYYL